MFEQTIAPYSKPLEIWIKSNQQTEDLEKDKITIHCHGSKKSSNIYPLQATKSQPVQPNLNKVKKSQYVMDWFQDATS